MILNASVDVFASAFNSTYEYNTFTKEYTVFANTTSDELTQDQKNVSSQGLLVLACLVIIPMIVLALFGNLLTIAAFIRDKQLHQSINIYILNLAIADFLIGLISMPIYLAYTLNNSVWIFGYHFCKVFILFDLIATSVSIEVMMLISYDRLMLLRHWSRHYNEQTRKKAYLRSGLTWIISLFVFGPATIFWDIWTGVNSIKPNDCEAQYVNNVIYTAIIATLELPFPFIVLSIFNTLIVLEIRKILSTRAELSNLSSLSSSRESTISMSHNDSGRGNVIHLHRRNSLKSKELFRMRSAKKATKSLAVLTIVFVLTWAPYAIVLALQSFCETCVSVLVYETCTWILWFKSSINPFLYAYNCNRFRANFKFFLCCERK